MSERDQIPFTWEPYGVNYRIIDGVDHELHGVRISGYYEVRLIEYIEKLEAENARLRPVYEAAARWADSPVRFNTGIVSGRLLVDLGNAVKEARDE